mmetsp:Transcript_29162/g.53226  ORF Transcript_29162/g.53226 Transcript_29162/m.53226 type:complete len:1250 (+) Transcript_29162:63-3812(+)
MACHQALRGHGTGFIQTFALTLSMLVYNALADCSYPALDSFVDAEESDIAVSMLQTQLTIEEATLKPGRLSASLQEVARKGALSETLARASTVSSMSLHERQHAYRCALRHLQDMEGPPRGCAEVSAAAMLAAIQSPPAADESDIAQRQAWSDAVRDKVVTRLAHDCAVQRLHSTEPAPKECWTTSPAEMFAALQSGFSETNTQSAAEGEALEDEMVAGTTTPAVVAPNMSVANMSESTNATVLLDSATITTKALEASGTSVWVALISVVLATICVKYLISRATYREMPDNRYIAEFVGVFFLGFVSTCCALLGVSAASGAFAMGFAGMVMTYALGPQSEGHINPAVSFACGLTRRMSWDLVWGYWVAQLAGGFVAAVAAQVMMGGAMTLPEPIDEQPVGWISVLLYEVIYSMFVCTVFLNCTSAVRNKENQFYGMAVGGALVAGLIHGQQFVGAFLNPAVAIGYDVCTLHDGIGLSLLWSGADMLGGFLAALLFGVLRPEDYMLEVNQVLYERPLWRRCLAEFYGVFILMLTLCAFAMPSLGEAHTAAVAACLISLIYTFGEHSGGHFNPAVTLTCVITGREVCAIIPGICYILSQCFGASLAAVISVFLRTDPEGMPLRSMTPGTGHSLLGAGVAEVAFTFLLTYTVLCVATAGPRDSPRALKSLLRIQPSQHANFHFGLSIGSCVLAGAAVGSVSGGVMNPALSVGMFIANLVKLHAVPKVLVNFAVYIACQFIGAIVAQVIFYITHVHEYDTDLPRNSVRDVVAKLTCEFVGTFMLAMGAMLVATASGSWSAAIMGALILALIACLGSVSGAHINPAVTFSFAIARLMPSAWHIIFYMLAQLLGGLLGCLTGYWLLLSEDTEGSMTGPLEEYTWCHAFVLEALFTFSLVFVVFNAAVSERNNPKQDPNHFYALAIALVLGAAAAACGGIAHGFLNPAIALGKEVSQLGTGHAFGWSLVWILAEFAGAAIALGAYRIVRPEEHTYTVVEEHKPREKDHFVVHDELHEQRPRFQAQCVAEFIGTFMLCSTVGICVSGGKGSATACAAAAMLAAMVYSLGNISGAHLNPAVTLTIVASGRDKCSLGQAGAYIIAQMLAGLLAGSCAWLFRLEKYSVGLAVPDGASLASVGFMEFFATFMLGYTVLTTATVPIWPVGFTNYSFGACIGLCVLIGGNAVGSISGGELNPAVSATISLIGLLGGSGLSGFANFGMFIVVTLFELAGGFLAATVFFASHPSEYKALLFGTTA